VRHQRTDEADRTYKLAAPVERHQIGSLVYVVFVDLIVFINDFHVPFLLIVKDNLALMEHLRKVLFVSGPLVAFDVHKHYAASPNQRSRPYGFLNAKGIARRAGEMGGRAGCRHSLARSSKTEIEVGHVAVTAITLAL